VVYLDFQKASIHTAHADWHHLKAKQSKARCKELLKIKNRFKELLKYKQVVNLARDFKCSSTYMGNRINK